MQVGMRSSTERFFAHLFSGPNADPAKGEAVVRKGALMNGISRVVTHLVGLHATPEDLAGATVVTVERKRAAAPAPDTEKPAPKGAKGKPATTTDEPTSPSELAALIDVLRADMEWHHGSPEAALAALKRYTAYTTNEGQRRHQTWETIRYSWQVRKAREAFEREVAEASAAAAEAGAQ